MPLILAQGHLCAMIYSEAGLPRNDLVNIIITEKTRRGVGYLSTEPLAGMYPIGTVFFLDWTWGDHQALTYAVTACHVVAGVRQDIFIEFTSQNGGVPPIPNQPPPTGLCAHNQ